MLRWLYIELTDEMCDVSFFLFHCWVFESIFCRGVFRNLGKLINFLQGMLYCLFGQSAIKSRVCQVHCRTLIYLQKSGVDELVSSMNLTWALSLSTVKKYDLNSCGLCWIVQSWSWILPSRPRRAYRYPDEFRCKTHLYVHIPIIDHMQWNWSAMECVKTSLFNTRYLGINTRG